VSETDVPVHGFSQHAIRRVIEVYQTIPGFIEKLISQFEDILTETVHAILLVQIFEVNALE
jgi:hypothetical protein